MVKIVKIILAFLIGMLTIGTMTVFAADTQTVFTLKPILPRNQINNSSYFDLKMQPKQQETVNIQVFNMSSKDMTYQVAINPAQNSNRGQISYFAKIENKHLRHSMKNLITYPDKIVVKAQSSQKVPITIKMPAKEYDGEVLMGVNVRPVVKATENKITSQYGYVIGLRLTENDHPVKRHIKITHVKVSTPKKILIGVKNPVFEAMGHVKYRVKVMNHAEKAVYTKTFSEKQLAPQSTYQLPLNLKKALTSGTYYVNLTITDEFHRMVKVSQKQAPAHHSWLIAGVVAGVLVIVGVVVLILRKRQ